MDDLTARVAVGDAMHSVYGRGGLCPQRVCLSGGEVALKKMNVAEDDPSLGVFVSRQKSQLSEEKNCALVPTGHKSLCARVCVCVFLKGGGEGCL